MSEEGRKASEGGGGWRPEVGDQRQCTFFIARRRRLCTLRCAPGSDLCSQHQPDALAASRARPKDPTTGTTLPQETRVRDGTRRRLSSRKRLRNPGCKQYQVPVVLAGGLSGSFAAPGLPLHLDVGCARGVFVERLAAESVGRWNYIGLELRYELAEAAQERVRRAGSGNVAFLGGNINVSIDSLIGGVVADKASGGAEVAGAGGKEAGAGAGGGAAEAADSVASTLSRITILFPDPWRRKRHRQRRVVTPEFVEKLANWVKDGCEIIIASDWRRVVQHMYRCFDDNDAFTVDVAEAKAEAEDADGEEGHRPKHPRIEATGVAAAESTAREADGDDSTGGGGEGADGADGADSDSEDDGSREYHWLRGNPLNIPTEREEVCERQWRPVYWARFRKVSA